MYSLSVQHTDRKKGIARVITQLIAHGGLSIEEGEEVPQLPKAKML